MRELFPVVVKMLLARSECYLVSGQRKESSGETGFSRSWIGMWVYPHHPPAEKRARW